MKSQKMKNLGTTIIVALILTMFMGSCKKDNYKEIIGTCPIVVTTDPANLAVNVPLNKVIKVTFNERMNPSTINQMSFTLKGIAKISGTLTYDDANASMSFTPSLPLVINTTYTGIVATSIQDMMGQSLQTEYVWIFSTGPTLAPIVISTDPVNLAINVPRNKIITANFSEAMDPLSITTGSTFTIKDGATTIGGTVTYSGTTATFTPAANLLSSTTYTATIRASASNVAGNPMQSDYVWTFSTVAHLGPAIVDLKTVARFGIIAGVGVSNNAGFSVINNMDVGISPGVRSSITGFPPATIVNGAIYASDDIAPPGVPAMLTQAKTDLTNAYLFAAGASMPAPVIVAGDQGGTTLAAGIYKSNSTLLIQAGDLTLDAQGDANAVWIFQIASGFTTVGGAGGNVILTNGAQAKNVFWQVGSSATIGDFTSFKGTIMALTSVTMNSGATATGRMLAINAAVVMTSTNIINKP